MKKFVTGIAIIVVIIAAYIGICTAVSSAPSVTHITTCDGYITAEGDIIALNNGSEKSWYEIDGVKVSEEEFENHPIFKIGKGN